MNGVPVTLSFQFPAAYGIYGHDNGTFTAYVTEPRSSANFPTLYAALDWLKAQLELEETRLLWEEYYAEKLDDILAALEEELEIEAERAGISRGMRMS